MPKIIKPVAKGDFTAATISVDSQGRVVTAASGSAGSAGMTPTLIGNRSCFRNFYCGWQQ